VTKVSNASVIAMLSELAYLTTLEEGTPQSFKVRAYETAVGAVEGYDGNVAELTLDELQKIKGIGESIAKAIREFVDSGSVARLETLRERYPPGLVEMSRIPGIGPKTTKLLRDELGVTDVESLQAAIDRQEVRALPGLGEKTEAKIGRAIQRLGLTVEDRRFPIAEALPLALRLCEEIRDIKGVVAVEHCGSLRRFSDTVGDIDITVATEDPQPVMDHVADGGVEVVAHGSTKTSIVTRSGLPVDCRAVEPGTFGAATLYFTGSKGHNIVLRQRAIDRGWLLNEYGLYEGENCLASETEAEIYEKLDLSYIPPEVRENSGEIEVAENGDFVDLVELSDIRGDLHYHTDRSGDGRSSLDEMVIAGVERGYAYLAITDHGENLSMNGLNRTEMLELRSDIDELATRYPDIRLLFGCELNIGPDGMLDYDEEFRSNFEWGVASVHSHFDLDQAQQTDRILKAIADPSVKAIGHLTGRYIGRRPGIDLDVDAVLEGLAEADVALEVNGALERLDAPATIVRKAVSRGVKLVISTDSHHVSELKRMAYGVASARRGWATKGSVANTMEAESFIAWATRDRS